MKKALLSLIFVFAGLGAAFSQCTELFLSEYVEGNYNNKALEIYNPTSNDIDLSGYQLVRYSNGSTSPNAVALAGTILAKDVYVTVLDKQDPNGTGLDTIVFDDLRAKADTFLCPVYSVNKMHYFNGDDAVTLELSDGTYIDIFGKIGEDPGSAWTTDTAAGFTDALGGRWWTRDHTLIRKNTVQQGVTTNPNFFNPAAEWDSLPKNTFTELGAHDCDCNNIGIEEVTVNYDAFFYPNPVAGQQFMVKATQIIKGVAIMNLSGQEVYTQLNDVERGDMHITLNNEFTTGIYMLRIDFADGSSIVKKMVLK